MRWLFVGVALLAVAASFAGGWRAGADRVRASQAAQEATIRQTAAEVEARVAERIAGIRISTQVISGKVREVIRENPVYRDCELPGDMQRLLEAARQGRAEPLSGGLSVPSVGAGSP